MPLLIIHTNKPAFSQLSQYVIDVLSTAQFAVVDYHPTLALLTVVIPKSRLRTLNAH